MKTNSRERDIIIDNSKLFFCVLVVTLSGTKRIVIFFGVATNNLFLSPPYQFPFYTYEQMPTVIEVGDLNNDGFIDLVIGRYSNISSENDKLSIFLNHGDGYEFDNAYSDTFWGSNNILSIVTGDLHHTGENEIYLISDDSYVRAFYATEYYDSLVYAPSSVYGMYGYPSMMIKGRFNDDEVDDLALLSSQSDTLNIIRSATYWLSYQQIYLTESYPTSIALINFNNDLLDDIAILSCNGTLTVFLAENIQLFDQNYLSFKLNLSNNGQCFHSLTVADLNQDGKDDLVFIDSGMNNVRVILGAPCYE